jgi:hypothetical protein
MAFDSDRAIKRLVSSPLFPLQGDFALKTLTPMMDAELPRDGEDGRPCQSCLHQEHVLWKNERWRITSAAPSANPVALFLETIDHVEFAEFDPEMAREFGLLVWHLELAIASIPAVGRVHIHHWGDGSSHFHVWFQGRPARQLELYGWGNVVWGQLLEPLSLATITANHDIAICRFSEKFSSDTA